MATTNRDFIVKNGLIVQGATATVNGNTVLTTASSIDALSDVVISTPSNGQVLSYNGTNWVNSSSGGGGTTTNALTIGTGLSGTSFDGSTAVTIAIDSSVVTTSGTQTLTNKTISVDSNTVSGIAASSFVLSDGSGNIDGSAAQKAIPTGTVVGTSDSQTLTNKTLGSSIALGADLSAATYKITGLGDPTAAQDAATKAYVDSVAQGLDIKASVHVATTAAGTLSTSFANGQTVDGVVLVTGDRILIKDQATASQNGIYTVNASGAPTRATDMDAAAEFPGAFTFVEEGTANADTGWVCTTNAPVTVGTTNITFSQFSGAGTYTAGTGLTLTGSQFSLTTPVSVANGGTGITSFGTGIATWLGTPSSANLAAAVTDETGSGSLVFATSPTLVTPNIGVATGTSFNSITGLSSTTPSANGTAAVGTGTTVARADHVHPTTGLGLTSGTLAQFAATTSSQLAGVISDETGSGALVFANTPTLVTPVLGVATATSINKVAITAPATSSTLTIANGKTFTASNTITISGTDGSTLNVGSGGTLGTGAFATIANYAPLAGATFTGQIQSTLANSTSDGGGQIYLNGATGNRIDFNQNGIAAPSFTTRSVGTKIVLYPNISGSEVDYAIGIEGSHMWYSVDTATSAQGFKWYAATTNVMTLRGNGTLSLNSTSSTLGASSATHQFGVVSGAAANVVSVIRGAVSQSAALTEWQDSAGTVLASMSSAGAFSAVTKSFDIEHPTKEGMRLRYGSLEGPENGVYVRGKSKEKTIELPDYWTGLVDEDTITVNLTAIGSGTVFVKEIINNTVVVGGTAKEFFFTVFGERKDVDKLTVEY